MARPIAADHENKRIAIRKSAAIIFAGKGYDRASMRDVAEACGVSKALLYHYYPRKESILFDIIRTHLVELVEAVRLADRFATQSDLRLQKIISAILECYKDADCEHKIQINNMTSLPDHNIAELRQLERQLVDMLAAVVCALNPSVDKRLVKPVTMAIFGTLNWKYMWFREGGAVSREDFAALAAQIFSCGIAAIPQTPTMGTERKKVQNSTTGTPVTSGRNQAPVQRSLVGPGKQE